MNYEELSKEVSYALRHAPWEYELEMDEEGWVSCAQLLDSLQQTQKFKNIRVTDLSKMIEISEKKRHEIKDGNIRAFYGHSLPMKILKEEKMPPNVLYHGTARQFFKSITEIGLQPRSRQYVHLSQDLETARIVGSRHDNKPCILIIDAKMAWSEGIRFYVGNEKVWLSDGIPAKYLNELSKKSNNID